MEEKGIKGTVESLRNQPNLPLRRTGERRFDAFAIMAEEQEKKMKKQSVKQPATPQLVVTLGSETMKVEPDGTVLPENIKYPPNSVIKLTGAGPETPNFSEMKVCVGPTLVTCPFILSDL